MVLVMVLPRAAVVPVAEKDSAAFEWAAKGETMGLPSRATHSREMSFELGLVDGCLNRLLSINLTTLHLSEASYLHSQLLKTALMILKLGGCVT
jgi:hypothetical protein